MAKRILLPIEKRDWLTAKECALKIGMGLSTLYAKLRHPKCREYDLLPKFRRHGREYRFPKTEVEAWEQRQMR